jgi:hypothetical protein
MGIKFHIDEPCFPIQVHVIFSVEGNEKVSPTTEISYVDHSNNFAYHQDTIKHDIIMNLVKNSHNIKFLRKSLNSSVDSIKMIIKHCTMMNNQVEQIISLQNKLYENLLEKRQVCGVETRRGPSTQDPDYPKWHPKRKDKDALKNKSST